MASPNQPVKRQNYNNSKKTSSRTPPTASAQPNSRDKIEKPQWSDMVKKSIQVEADTGHSSMPVKESTKVGEPKEVDWKEVFQTSHVLAPGQKRIPKRSPISVADAVVFRVVTKKTGNNAPGTGKAQPKTNPTPTASIPKSLSKNNETIVNPATGAVIEKKGKAKGNNRPKKLTKLKMSILEDREEQIGSIPSKPSSSDPTSEVCPPTSYPTSDGKAPQMLKVGSRVVEIKTERDARFAHLKSLKKPSPTHSASPDAFGWKSTSKIFPLLFHNLVTPELNSLAENMLTKLSVFHYRAKLLKEKKPSKAKRGMRFVAGFSQCLRSVVLKRCKMLMIAPNVDKSESEGGLDALMLRLVKIAKIHDIPFLFVLNRRKLASCINVNVRVSVIAVLSADGAYEEYEKLKIMVHQNMILSAFKYKKEVDDVLRIQRQLTILSGSGDDVSVTASTDAAEKDRSESPFSVDSLDLPRIDRLALVDSTNLNKVIVPLGPNPRLASENMKNEEIHTVQLDMASLSITEASWAIETGCSGAETSSTDFDEYENKSTKLPIPRPQVVFKGLSIRCFTSVPHIGSVRWSVKAVEGPKDEEIQTSRSTASSLTEPTVALISQYDPFVLRAYQGKHVQNVDFSKTLSNGHQNPLESGESSLHVNKSIFERDQKVKEYEIEARLFSECNGNGIELSRSCVRLTLIWPSQHNEKANEISVGEEEMASEDHESKLDETIDSIFDNASDSDNGEESEEEEDLMNLNGDEVASTDKNTVRTPITVGGSSDVSSSHIPSQSLSTSDSTWEEAVMEEEKRKQERKERRKALANKKRSTRATLASIQAKRNEINRMKHARPAPIYRPDVDAHSEAKEDEQWKFEPPFSPSFTSPLASLITSWNDLKQILVSNSNQSTKNGDAEHGQEKLILFLQLSRLSLPHATPPSLVANHSTSSTISSDKSSNKRLLPFVSTHFDPTLLTSTTYIAQVNPNDSIISLIKLAANHFQLKPKTTNLHLGGIPLSKLLISSSLQKEPSRTSQADINTAKKATGSDWIHQPISSVPFLSDGASLTVHPCK